MAIRGSQAVLVGLAAEPADPAPEILVLRPGALGDALLAVPALRALRRRFPGWRLTFASHLGAARLLHAAGEIDQPLAYDDPALQWVFGLGTTETVPQVVVAWQRDAEGALRRRLEAMGVRQVLIAPSRPEGAGVHLSEYLLTTLRPLGVPSSPDASPLAVPATRTDEVLVHPGSGALAKNWPVDRFAEALGLLVRGGARVRVVVGEADHEAAVRLRASMGDEVAWLEQPPLADLAARLAGCRAYLGNDSGVSHLAGLVGAPTIALFGPTDPRTWAPIGPRVRVQRFEASPSEVAAAVLESARSGESTAFGSRI